MKPYLSLIIAILAIQTNLFAAEAGMPQLDPTYWASQAFWLILAFTTLYVAVAKIFIPKDTLAQTLTSKIIVTKGNKTGSIDVKFTIKDFQFSTNCNAIWNDPFCSKNSTSIIECQARVAKCEADFVNALRKAQENKTCKD